MLDEMLKYKIINYFGDYGTANFWSNIKDQEISEDLKFIKNKGFNAILLLVPYVSFKPHLDSFENKYENTLNKIFDTAQSLQIEIIIRIGYLWESSFQEERTFERYVDFYSCYKKRKKSLYEKDFIEYINYFYNKYEILHMILSWEDFFWPIHYYNKDKRNEDQYIEKETVKFLTYLLKKIGYKEKLHIEQRTNGDFDKIEYNDSISYAYYNTFNILSWEDDFVGRNFGRGIIVDESMLISKQFIEWYSRMKQVLKLDSSQKLIIDQFNIIDNTFSEDLYHYKYTTTKQKLICKEADLDGIFSFLAPIIKHNLYGIGFWSLWTTIAGHIYNGTFKFDTEGWETNGECKNQSIYLKINQSISTHLDYIRLDATKTWNIFLKYSSDVNSKIILKFNNTNEVIALKRGQNISIKRSFNYIENKELSVTCINGNLNLERIDCFNLLHKSFLFDENKNPLNNISSLNNLLN